MGPLYSPERIQDPIQVSFVPYWSLNLSKSSSPSLREEIAELLKKLAVERVRNLGRFRDSSPTRQFTDTYFGDSSPTKLEAVHRQIWRQFTDKILEDSKNHVCLFFEKTLKNTNEMIIASTFTVDSCEKWLSFEHFIRHSCTLYMIVTCIMLGIFSVCTDIEYWYKCTSFRRCVYMRGCMCVCVREREREREREIMVDTARL